MLIQRAIRALRAPYDVWLVILTYLPGTAGDALRYWHWRSRLKYLGKGVRIGVGVRFQNPRFITISDNCWIDDFVIIMAGADSRAGREKHQISNPAYAGKPGHDHIGNNVHIAPNCIISGISSGVWIGDDCGLSSGCKLYAFSHHYRSKKNPSDRNVSFGPMVEPERQCMVEGPIMIGRNTGLALNTIVLPGAHIPQDCFTAPGAVVKAGVYEPNSILEGNPAKVAGNRYTEPTVISLRLHP